MGGLPRRLPIQHKRRQSAGRRHPAKRLALLVVAAVVAAPVAPADVIVVDLLGGGDFTEANAAAAAAADGDTLLLRVGDYTVVDPFDSFIIDGKGLTVVADRPGFVTTDAIVVRNVPAGKTVVLRGLTATGQFNDYPWGISVTDCAGTVVLEDCTLTGRLDFPEGAPGLHAKNSDAIHVMSCMLTGGDGLDAGTFPIGQQPAGHGAPAVIADDCRIALHSSVLAAGKGGDDLDADFGPAGNGGDAFCSRATVSLVSGCRLVGGDGGEQGAPGGGAGGHAVDLLGGAGSSALLIDNDLEVGTGGALEGGGSAADGEQIHDPGGTATVDAGTARTLDVTTPVGELQLGAIACGGEVGDDVLLLLSPAAGWLSMPARHGVYALADPLLLLVSLGTIVAPDGGLAFPFAMPSVGLAPDQALTLFVQAGFVNGSEVYVGEPSTLLVFDTSLL